MSAASADEWSERPARAGEGRVAEQVYLEESVQSVQAGGGARALAHRAPENGPARAGGEGVISGRCGPRAAC